jgi:hypothetical protein
MDVRDLKGGRSIGGLGEQRSAKGEKDHSREGSHGHFGPPETRTKSSLYGLGEIRFKKFAPLS